MKTLQWRKKESGSRGRGLPMQSMLLESGPLAAMEMEMRLEHLLLSKDDYLEHRLGQLRELMQCLLVLISLTPRPPD